MSKQHPNSGSRTRRILSRRSQTSRRPGRPVSANGSRTDRSASPVARPRHGRGATTPPLGSPSSQPARSAAHPGGTVTGRPSPRSPVGVLRKGKKAGGERGIRTPGTRRYSGFRDRPVRPLRHLSAVDDRSGRLAPCGRFAGDSTSSRPSLSTEKAYPLRSGRGRSGRLIAVMPAVTVSGAAVRRIGVRFEATPNTGRRSR